LKWRTSGTNLPCTLPNSIKHHDSITHSFEKYLISPYHIKDTVLGTGVVAVNKTNEKLCPQEVIFQWILIAKGSNSTETTSKKPLLAATNILSDTVRN